jgi:hypothetical protein
MINPLNWKPERLFALLISLIPGAVIGIVVGFAIQKMSPSFFWSFGQWLTEYTSDAFLWAAFGAVATGCVVYLRMLFSTEAP